MHYQQPQYAVSRGGPSAAHLQQHQQQRMDPNAHHHHHSSHLQQQQQQHNGLGAAAAGDIVSSRERQRQLYAALIADVDHRVRDATDGLAARLEAEARRAAGKALTADDVQRMTAAAQEAAVAEARQARADLAGVQRHIQDLSIRLEAERHAAVEQRHLLGYLMGRVGSLGRGGGAAFGDAALSEGTGLGSGAAGLMGGGGRGGLSLGAEALLWRAAEYVYAIVISVIRAGTWLLTPVLWTLYSVTLFSRSSGGESGSGGVKGFADDEADGSAHRSRSSRNRANGGGGGRVSSSSSHSKGLANVLSFFTGSSSADDGSDSDDVSDGSFDDSSSDSDFESHDSFDDLFGDGDGDGHATDEDEENCGIFAGTTAAAGEKGGANGAATGGATDPARFFRAGLGQRTRRRYVPKTYLDECRAEHFKATRGIEWLNERLRADGDDGVVVALNAGGGGDVIDVSADSTAASAASRRIVAAFDASVVGTAAAKALYDRAVERSLRRAAEERRQRCGGGKGAAISLSTAKQSIRRAKSLTQTFAFGGGAGGGGTTQRSPSAPTSGCSEAAVLSAAISGGARRYSDESNSAAPLSFDSSSSQSPPPPMVREHTLSRAASGHTTATDDALRSTEGWRSGDEKDDAAVGRRDKAVSQQQRANGPPQKASSWFGWVPWIGRHRAVGEDDHAEEEAYGRPPMLERDGRSAQRQQRPLSGTAGLPPPSSRNGYPPAGARQPAYSNGGGGGGPYVHQPIAHGRTQSQRSLRTASTGSSAAGAVRRRGSGVVPNAQPDLLRMLQGGYLDPR